MPFLVTRSSRPVVFDALPALKVNWYHTPAAMPKVYSYARFYLHRNALALSLYAFERDPLPESRVAFALGGNSGRFLLLALGPHTVQLSVHGPEEHSFLWQPPLVSLPPPAPQRFTGEDEQGWHWGALLQMDRPLLQQVGFSPDADGEFRAAVFKYSTNSQDYGASFASNRPDALPVWDDFGRFVPVDY